MISVDIKVSIYELGALMKLGPPAEATTSVYMDERDFNNLEYGLAFRRLMKEARELYNAGQAKENQIPE